MRRRKAAVLVAVLGFGLAAILFAFTAVVSAMHGGSWNALQIALAAACLVLAIAVGRMGSLPPSA